MKKPVVDYRTFRLSKLNDPQFSHLKLLLGWVGYFALYFLTENLIPAYLLNIGVTRWGAMGAPPVAGGAT